MQIEYNNKRIVKFFSDYCFLERKIGFELTKITKKRINQLEACDNFYDYLELLKLGKPHSLNGNLKGCYGISLNGNYRLIVEPIVMDLSAESLKVCKNVNIKGVLDYHGEKNEWIIP